MRSGAWLLLRVAVSASILAVMLSRVSLEALPARVSPEMLLWLLPALLLPMLSIVLVALRWRVLAGWLGFPMPPRVAVRALFVAMFGGQLLPSSIGADVLRGYLAARHAEGLGRIIASLVVDRLVALFAASLLILGAVGGYLGAGMALFAGSLLVIFVLACSGALRIKAVRAVEGVKLRAKPLVLAMGLALVVQGGAVAMAALVAKAYGVEAAFGLWMAVIPLSVVASAVPISINGWGVREATIVALAGGLGVPGAEALLVSLTLGLLNMVATLPGALAMLRGGRPQLGIMWQPPKQ